MAEITIITLSIKFRMKYVTVLIGFQEKKVFFKPNRKIENIAFFKKF